MIGLVVFLASEIEVAQVFMDCREMVIFGTLPTF
jgi:hypothetical protein